MTTIIHDLKQKCYHALVAAFPDAHLLPEAIEITLSTHAKFGHYQCNSAMKLSGALNAKPRDIAEQLVTQLTATTATTPAMIAHAEVAGPGFINLTLSTTYLATRTETLLRDAHLGIDVPATPKKVIIDFSSPNTAKEMHVGHLRSTIIGDCLARLFEFLGENVLRLNHVGDWGTQFGMLITYLKETVPDVLSGEAPTDLSHLVVWYRAAKQRFDEDASFKKRAQLEVVALQSGEPNAMAAWQHICAISRQAYQEIYDLLGVQVTERGESFYNPMLAATVADLEAKGLITLSDGAKCLFLEGFVNREGDPLPLIVEKSDGGFNYATTDLAALQHRIADEHADRIIYVTDAGQAMHFKMIFMAAIRAGYLDPQQVTVNHVPFGLVLGPDGKKFKTRSGETERLIDLINAAIAQAKTILVAREVAMDKVELEHTAHTLGINAIKYADLSCHRTNDYCFSYERMLRFEGNTAAFLMYAYVRVNSIKRKVGVDVTQLMQRAHISLVHPTEIALALQLNQFNEVLLQMADDLLPHRLTEYLFHLAERFNAFFRDCRVEGDPAQDARLLLCEAVGRVMHVGLSILGLQLIEKM